MKKTNQSIGRPLMDPNEKVYSRYVLRLSVEEKAIVLAHLSLYEAKYNRQGVSISEYIRILLPCINETTISEPLNNRSARKDTWLFFCNNRDWEKVNSLAAAWELSKNDFLVRVALSGNSTGILK